jgi:dTDP-4-amino-4,6-dideoxygalactose transaminase
VFSFHATKFFNTFEGGAITTRDAALAARLRLMINFGFSGYDNVISAGTNGKMTEVCAAMGLTGLESLDAFVAANRRNYECYRRELDGMAGLSLLAYDPRQTPNYQYVVAEVGPQFPLSRDDVVAVLQAENVLARRYFWPGCHGMPYYRERMPAAGERLPGTQAVAQGVVVLPTGSAVSEETVAAVAAIVRLAADNAPAVRRALSGRK